MWRDPMDDLIEELDEVAPTVHNDSFTPMSEVIKYTDVILYGSDEARERLELDPGYARFRARLMRSFQATPSPEVDSTETSRSEEGSDPPDTGD